MRAIGRALWPRFRCREEDVTVNVTVNPNDITRITDYCRNDESITQESWRDRCGEYVELETVGADEPLDLWYCAECGSQSIEVKVWTDSNTRKITDEENIESNDPWCNDCERHTSQVQQSELIQTDRNWWIEDFKQMERITGFRQLDFDPKDGCQAFVDACTEWWNSKTTDEKITIYFDKR